MIDVHSEHIMTLAAAARAFPPIRHGKSVSPSTLHRWHRKGLRGVRLEVASLGGVQSDIARGDFPIRSRLVRRCHTRRRPAIHQVGKSRSRSGGTGAG